jgi:tRNA(fMet)-specific endonuclease VapC
VTFLLDTNACIALLNGRPTRVRERLNDALRHGATVWASAIVAFELWYGVGKSVRRAANTERLERLLNDRLPLVVFDHEDARAAGALRAELESVGRPLGAYDLLIAAQALRREWTLVSTDTRGLHHVRGLRWQDWARGGA